jgi:catechol 2,3-dioxygenase-like lactoylglutathione lyase family enzyme
MKVNHICLVVKDMDKSIRFYQDVLGLELLQDIEIPTDSGNEWHNPRDLDDCFGVENSKSRQVAFIDEAGIALELQSPTIPEVKSGSQAGDYGSTGMKELAFTATNIDKEVDRLKKLGVEFRTRIFEFGKGTMFGCRSILFYDPDGNILQLVETPGNI